MISLMEKKMQCREHGLSIVGFSKIREKEKLLLVFSVTPLKINQNQNRSIDKVLESGKWDMQRPSRRFRSVPYMRLSGEMLYPNS